MTMNSRVVLTLCSIAILLLVVSTSVVVDDDQYYPEGRKVPNKVWLLAHHFQPSEKRDRFVFRQAQKKRRYDPMSDLGFINNDQNDDSNVDKRNWRF